MSVSRRVVAGAVLAVLCTTLGVLVATSLFLLGSRSVVVAGHDAVVHPTITGEAVVRTGPLLPDVRMPDVGPVGVTLVLGKTEVGSIEELAQRYAFIASQPDAQVAKVRGAVVDLAVASALRGVAVGALPAIVWLLLGSRRRHELGRRLHTTRGLAVALSLLLVPVLVVQPWRDGGETQEEQGDWVTLGDFLGSQVPLPDEAADLEVLAGPTTLQTKRLVESAISTYDKSKQFYAAAATDAAELDGIRAAEEGETVALLVTDRHDNIGMDPVARAIGERAGATVVLTGGDDTSTGASWEAFSLDSLADTFEDWDRFGVAGNHDHGTFVRRTLADRVWEMLDGEPVDAPWGATILGVDDPRSSGLGNWRDETGLSFGEVGERLADVACEAEEPISLLLVHDANLGRQTLYRGCADLVVGGHVHVHRGPEEVLSEDGRRRGYTWTNGTTGGAAYAIAVGSKPRRDADVSLITFADGRPIGLQWVRLRTDGSYVVGEWEPIAPGDDLTPA